MKTKDYCETCSHHGIPEDKPFCVVCVSDDMTDDPPTEYKQDDSRATTTPHIKDSGNRTEFASGAVRDIQTGKGRCDLLPLDVIGTYMQDDVFSMIACFQQSGNVQYLYTALDAANIFENDATMFLEVAIHFEEGAKKYGDNNWRKGIPVSRYIDSGVRHYLKHLRGDRDEPHDRAFCWNLLCGIWTCNNLPELNDYRRNEERA